MTHKEQLEYRKQLREEKKQAEDRGEKPKKRRRRTRKALTPSVKTEKYRSKDYVPLSNRPLVLIKTDYVAPKGAYGRGVKRPASESVFPGDTARIIGDACDRALVERNGKIPSISKDQLPVFDEAGKPSYIPICRRTKKKPKKSNDPWFVLKGA